LIVSATVIVPGSGMGKPAVISTGPVCGASAYVSLLSFTWRYLVVEKACRDGLWVELGRSARGEV